MKFEEKNAVKDDKIVLVHSVEKIDFKWKRDGSIENQ